MSEHDAKFIAYLSALARRQKRGALAELRRTLGQPPGTAGAQLHHLWLPPGLAPGADTSYHLVAALYALHPEDWPPPDGGPRPVRNLGVSFAEMARRRRAEAGSEPGSRLPGFDLRFTALLASHSADLHVHLRHAATLLAAYKIPVDWRTLLADLQQWERADKQVQRRWARAYWVPAVAGEKPDRKVDNQRFLAHLQGLNDREDAAALATLRRGLGIPAGTVMEMWQHLWLPAVPRQGQEGHQAWEERRARLEAPYFLVASLYAFHPLQWPAGQQEHFWRNLGASFAELARRQRSRSGLAAKKPLPSTDARFAALLTSHADDLHIHLRHATSLLKSHGVPLDWLQLLADLQRWGDEDRTVQRNWARAYWEHTRDEAAENAADVS